MSWTAPGVNFSEKEVVQSVPADATAVPVFVGFTEAAAEVLTLFSSWTAFQETGGIEVSAWSDSPLAVALRLYFDNGGTHAWVLSAGPLPTGDIEIAAALQTTLRCESLATQTQITLLCVPDVMLLQEPDGTAWVSIWQTMLELACRRNGFALLDLPPAPAVAYALMLRAQQMAHAEFGATYWPHLETRYRIDDAWVRAAPGGAIAAVIQQVDTSRGVWKAPANVVLQQVVRPQYTLEQGPAVFAQAAQVNLIRSFPGRGVRVWGCRTLMASQTSPWRFVQVRRLLSTIQSRLAALCHFCVFEPNNEITWFKLKSLCRSELRAMWLEGALYGTSEEEALRVFVGLDESMTREDILAGCLILKVEVAALYPAEYIAVSLRFNLMNAELQSAKEQG
jgi:uncharacterized protein